MQDHSAVGQLKSVEFWRSIYWLKSYHWDNN